MHGQAWKRREHGSGSRARRVGGAGGMRGGDSCGHGGKCTCERAKTVQHTSVSRRDGWRAGYTWSTLVRIEPPTPRRYSCARARSLFAPPLHPARALLRAGVTHWMHTCSRRCHLTGAASLLLLPASAPTHLGRARTLFVVSGQLIHPADPTAQLGEGPWRDCYRLARLRSPRRPKRREGTRPHHASRVAANGWAGAAHVFRTRHRGGLRLGH